MFGLAKKTQARPALENGMKLYIPPAMRLTGKAAEKFAVIQDSCRDAYLVTQNAAAAHRTAQEEFQAASRDFEMLKSRGNAQPAEYQAAEEAKARALRSLDRPKARYDHAKSISDEAGTLSQNLERWIDTIPNEIALKAIDTPKPKLVKGESLQDAIDRCRRSLKELSAQAITVRAAPVFAADAKAVLKRYVALLSKVGEPDLKYVIDGGQSRVDWPDRLEKVGPEFGLGQFSAPVVLPALALAAWLDADRLYARLCRQVDEEADDKRALSASDRLKQSMSIAAEALSVAREEESLIMQAWDVGQVITRRANADPRAVLSLSSDLPPAEDR